MRVTNKCLKRRNSRSSSLKMELKVPEILWALKKSSYRLGFLSHTSLIHYFVSPFFLPFLQNIMTQLVAFWEFWRSFLMTHSTPTMWSFMATSMYSVGGADGIRVNLPTCCCLKQTIKRVCHHINARFHL